MNYFRIYEYKGQNKYDEIQDIVVGEVPDYPKYTTQILNLANQNSQGTRPKVVGQMSDLIRVFDGRTVEEWIEWYEEGHPDAREKASDKVEDMVIKLKDAPEFLIAGIIRDLDSIMALSGNPTR